MATRRSWKPSNLMNGVKMTALPILIVSAARLMGGASLSA
ncbi:hypothetical protein CSE45_4972 [Citreicella sp. SE45]|nr:hypothetical protein CSE45_4972 [Citreicella sp. SE45]